MLIRGDRDIVDIPTYDYCLEIVELLKENDSVKNALGLEGIAEHIQIFNEVQVSAEELPGYSNLPFGFKGILDNVRIDHKAKEIQIVDLKTSSKSVSEFKEAVEFWNLWLQAALYVKLTQQSFLISNNINPDEWKITFSFLVVDKYKQIYLFQVSDETMIEWTKKLDNKIAEATWHFQNERFDLPYELATSTVLL